MSETLMTKPSSDDVPEASTERRWWTRFTGVNGLGAFYERWGITIFLLLFLAFAVATEPSFGRATTFQSILRDAPYLGIAAIGMTLAIMSGVFDLSVAAILAFSAVLTLQAFPSVGVAGAFLVAVAAGIACGTVNGLLVSRLRIPAFVATLGTLFVFRGITYLLTDGAPVRIPNEAFGGTFTQIGSEGLVGIPYPFFVMLAAFGIGFVLLRRTAFGRRLLAVGSNEAAARFCGIHVPNMRLITFVLVGAFMGVSSLMYTTRTWTADGGAQNGFELVVIATVVLGGTSLAGGKGSLLGTFSAALLITSLQRYMALSGVPSFYYGIVTGFVLLLALGIDGLRLRFAEPGSFRRAIQSLLPAPLRRP